MMQRLLAAAHTSEARSRELEMNVLNSGSKRSIAIICAEISTMFELVGDNGACSAAKDVVGGVYN